MAPERALEITQAGQAPNLAYEILPMDERAAAQFALLLSKSAAFQRAFLGGCPSRGAARTMELVHRRYQALEDWQSECFGL